MLMLSVSFLLLLLRVCIAGENHEYFAKGCHPASCSVEGECYCSDYKDGWYDGGAGYGPAFRARDQSLCYKAGKGDCECADCGFSKWEIFFFGDTQCQEFRCEDTESVAVKDATDDSRACYRVDPTRGRIYTGKRTYYGCYKARRQCDASICKKGEKLTGCMRTSSGTCKSCGSLSAGSYWTKPGSCDTTVCGVVEPGYYMTAPCSNTTNVMKLHCSTYMGNPLAASFPNPVAQYYCPGGAHSPVRVPSFGAVNALYTDFNCQPGYFKQGIECRTCLPGSSCLHDKSYTCKADYYTDKYAQSVCKRCTATCTYDSEVPMRCQEGSIQNSRCVPCGMCGVWPANGVNCVRNQDEFIKLPEYCTPRDTPGPVIECLEG